MKRPGEGKYLNSRMLSILLIILAIFLNSAGATYVSRTDGKVGFHYTTLATHTNQSTQVIIKIPFTAMPNVKEITAYQEFAFCSSPIKPNGPLHIRVYTYDDAVPATYYLQDYINLDNTSCHDYGEPTLVQLNTPINVQSFNGTYINGVAFGFYADPVSQGNWYFPFDVSGNANNQLIATFSNTKLSYSATVKDVNGNNVLDGYSNTIYTSNIWLLGNFIFPPTPSPTPTPPTGIDPNGTQIMPGDCTYEQLINGGCNNPPPIPGIGPGGFNNTPPDFTKPDSACPECPNNQTVVPDGTLEPDNSGSVFLKGLGYCTTTGCTIDDIIAFFYDITLLGIISSYGAVFYKAYRILKERW